MKRPAFEQMIARATDGTRTVDAIMLSRAFRNQVEQDSPFKRCESIRWN
ncbi:hypothetical protein QWJ07_16650 [Frankia sp. RB7]|nr:hypothetical protein [Frankia sp. RB7]